jgi:hypothetical protein
MYIGNPSKTASNALRGMGEGIEARSKKQEARSKIRKNLNTLSEVSFVDEGVESVWKIARRN